jgi:nitroreductase
MDVLEAIFTRRSIRKFTEQPVDDEDLHMILRAGCYAPSARNSQPWHFVVVRDCASLDAIAQDHPYAKMMPQAGCCVVVCGDKTKQGMTGFLIEDCSAALQNMLLAAHGLGLGAVWCGLYPLTQRTKVVQRLLHLPPNIMPVGMFALGHKAEERTTEERFDPDKVHFEKW